MKRPTIDKAELELAEALKQIMQVLLGANDVVRGDPQESLKSGAALALVQAMALQHNSQLQRAAAYLLDQMAARVVETYRVNATVERMVEATGTTETATVKKYIGTDLGKVASVRVQLANALLRTTAGKKEIADFYADPNRFPMDQPMTRAQHQEFMATGRMTPIFRAARSEQLAIRETLEALTRGDFNGAPIPIPSPMPGMPPQMVHPAAADVLIIDNHPVYIRELRTLLDGRRRRELHPETIVAVTERILAHEMNWQRLTAERPAALAALGIPPAPMPMMMGPGGPMPPDGPPGPGGPPAGPEDAPTEALEPPPAAPGGPGGAQGPDMPQMPVDPSTGERVQAPGRVVA
jgi:hypothetical protein